jgi:hypothetical protein
VAVKTATGGKEPFTFGNRGRVGGDSNRRWLNLVNIIYPRLADEIHHSQGQRDNPCQTSDNQAHPLEELFHGNFLLGKIRQLPYSLAGECPLIVTKGVTAALFTIEPGQAGLPAFVVLAGHKGEIVAYQVEQTSIFSLD